MRYEWEKFFRFFLSPFFPKNTEYEKKIEIIFCPKRSLWNACTIYENMDPVFGLSSEI